MDKTPLCDRATCCTNYFCSVRALAWLTCGLGAHAVDRVLGQRSLCVIARTTQRNIKRGGSTFERVQGIGSGIVDVLKQPHHGAVIQTEIHGAVILFFNAHRQRLIPLLENIVELHLKGKRVLITGGSKGIGKAAAMDFALEGCEVMIASREEAALAATTAEIIKATGAKVTYKAIDLAKRGAAESLTTWAGDLDILVNNAGAIPGGDLLTVDEDTWRNAWDLKVFGYINLCRAVYRNMKAKQRGVIINVLGAAGERLNAAYVAGSTANAGLMAFTRTLGGASPQDGIRVLGVSPGPVATDRLIKLYKQMAQTKLGDAERYQELFAGMAFNRPATPEEISATIVFAASDRSSYTTGVYLTVDGGSAAGK